jgi:hypothetical protein
MGVKCVDKEIVKSKPCGFFAIFILSSLLLICNASAQCGDCNDGNACTRDYCDGERCFHEPQSCDDAGSSVWPFSAIKANDGNPDNMESSRQNGPGATNISEDCDDKNPCTRDYYGEAGCVHDLVNCDDGNACTMDYCGAAGCVHDPVNCDDANTSTADLCSPSGCINTPLSREGGNANINLLEIINPVQTKSPEMVMDENTAVNESQESQVVNDSDFLLPVCDDGDPCTTDTYNGASCIYESVDCNDGNDSTLDSCSNGACINKPIDYEMVLSENSCDDHDPCTDDTFNGTGCENTPRTCEDGNDSTLDSCSNGVCVNEPTDREIILSENNSTLLSSGEALMAHHPHGCDEHNPCDDGNPATYDYCYKGKCYNTTTSCDDGNNCTKDSYNGTACVHVLDCGDGDACTTDTCDGEECKHTPKSCDDGNPCTADTCDHKKGCQSRWKCDDSNPCTVDHCDTDGGCWHSYVVCPSGKICINGVCQYPYYVYAVPYYYPPYAPAASTLPAAQSYIIPAGTVITLPWGQTVTSLSPLRVENGMAYAGVSPLRFTRVLGTNQPVSGSQSGPLISEQAEMIGLAWKDAFFNLTLVQPNGSALPAQSDSRDEVHLVGSNYNYYFLKSPARGNWTIEIRPINPGANGAGFSLLTGLVKGAPSLQL